MILKSRIASFLNQLMEEIGATQKDMATILEVSQSRIQAYLKEKEVPRVETIMKMAQLGGISIDDLLKTDKPPKEIHIEVKNSKDVNIAGGDIYNNTIVRKTHKYTPQTDDLNSKQASRLKELVNKIVELERVAKKKPKGYGAVWNALNRKMGVTYYREIKHEQYSAAELYLTCWTGRIKRPLKQKDTELWRKERQRAVFAATRTQLGWSKTDLDNFIFEKYNKSSIKNLSKMELEQLYNIVMKMKS